MVENEAKVKLEAAMTMSLGPCTALTCDQARTQAITIIAAVKNGEDPTADHTAKRNAATVNDLADRFDKEHIAVRLKASTAKEYRGNLRRFILPALGRLAVPEITRADVAKFHHDLLHIPIRQTAASRWFPRCSCWPKCGGCGPADRTRASAAELRRIGEVLRELKSERIELSSSILAARLLILTGCRLGEIMTLKWNYVDFDERALRLPDSKTGKKVMHVGAPAVEYLHSAHRIDGNPWVGQSADVVPLQTAVQARRSENDPGDRFPEGRSRQERDRRLERIKAIV